MELTTEIVRELLDYDQDTGVFTWKDRERHWFKTNRDFKTWNTRYAGRVAGYADKNASGYSNLSLGMLGNTWYAHRIAFLWMGEVLPEQVDHLDRNALNNKWTNLVASSGKENMKNLSMKRNNTSGVTGVCWNKAKGKWSAYVTTNKKQKHLGMFAAEELHLAAEAVKKFRADNGFSDGHGEEFANYLDNTGS